MTETKAPLSYDGMYAVATIGAATIKLQRIRPGAYRVEVSHSSPFGAVVDELTMSYPSERSARLAARRLYRLFWDGLTIAQVIARRTVEVDTALDRAWQGGDGTGRQHAPIAALTAEREQLRPATERAEHAARLAEMADALAANAPRDPNADRWAAFDALPDYAEQMAATIALAPTVQSLPEHDRRLTWADLRREFAESHRLQMARYS